MKSIILRMDKKTLEEIKRVFPAKRNESVADYFKRLNAEIARLSAGDIKC